MCISRLFAAGAIAATTIATSALAQAPVAPTETPRRGLVIPQGVVTKHEISHNLFDWVELHREYFVYVPAQYDGASDAALLVFQDGHIYADENSTQFNPEFSTPEMLDELIHADKLPVAIAIFVNPGHQGEEYPENRFFVSHRGEEYDEMSDRYVSFIINVLIPEVAKQYRLTENAKQRAIVGFSSGGACAFTAAWQRPDYFHRVVSFSGSFVNIRGGHEYPFLVRASPRKDLKVYLQSGANDLDIVFGNWRLANEQMAAALKFKGYDYKFEQTAGQHGQFMMQNLKEALAWAWRDEPHVSAER